MKKLTCLMLLITLSACVGGNTAANCEAATRAFNAAQLASIAAEANAKINPQSANMQKLAEYAALAFTIATVNQANACAAPVL